MSTPLIDNFELNTDKPIDNRFVIGTGLFYEDKDDITHKYEGLRVWDIDVGNSFYWDGSTWIEENQSTGLVDGSIGRIALFTQTDTVSDSIIYQVGNKIGINNSNPQYNIDVNGNCKINDFIDIGSSIRHIGDSDTMIRFSSSDTIQMVTNNNTRIHVSPNGNVGIKTTSPSDDFEVNGSMTLKSGNPIKLFGNNTGSDNVNFISFHEQNGNIRQGFVGFPSSNNGNFVIKNDITDKFLSLNDNGKLSYSGDVNFDGDSIIGGKGIFGDDIVSDGYIESTKGYYNFNGPSTGNTNVGDWLKIFSINYNEFSGFTFKLSVSGNSTTGGYNSDIHINFKSGTNFKDVQLNICNYGTIPIKENEIDIIREGSNTNGNLYIYHKINKPWVTPIYSIIGRINSQIQKYEIYTNSIDVTDGGWREKTITNGINSIPENGQMGLVPLRSIMMFSGTDSQVPNGWRLCHGGSANGINIPDLRNRFVISKGSKYALNQTNDFSSENSVLVNHNHGGTISGGNHRHDFDNGYALEKNGILDDNITANSSKFGKKSLGYTNLRGVNGGDSDNNRLYYYRDVTKYDSHTHTINSDGESGIGKNIPPYYALAYIIYVGI